MRSIFSKIWNPESNIRPFCDAVVDICNAMIRFATVIFLFIMYRPASSHSQGIQFESGFLSEVFEKAYAEQKPVFVDVFATWCAPCRYMDQHVFPDSALGEYVNKHFVSVQLDAEAGEGIAFAREYMVRVFPTYLIFDANKKLLSRTEGIMDPQSLKMWLSVGSTPNMPTSKRITRKQQKGWK
jgi:thiol:disulfide interchange protein